MKSSARQYLYSVFRQVAQEFRQIGQKVGERLLGTPLPKVLMVCVGIALLIAIIPLIITLFIVFVLLKLLLAVVLMSMGQNQARAKPKSRPVQTIYIEQHTEKQ